jgi:hypothetical protein
MKPEQRAGFVKPAKRAGFLDDPVTQKKFRQGFYLSLCLLLGIDLLSWIFFDRQVHFAWEAIPFFNAVYGFVGCVALIFLAKILRFFVRRKEDYYG